MPTRGPLDAEQAAALKIAIAAVERV